SSRLSIRACSPITRSWRARCWKATTRTGRNWAPRTSKGTAPTWRVSRPDWSMKRSEEHTSELQSRENLVCRLLLEKKKNTLTRRTLSLRLFNDPATTQRYTLSLHDALPICHRDYRYGRAVRSPVPGGQGAGRLQPGQAGTGHPGLPRARHPRGGYRGRIGP